MALRKRRERYKVIRKIAQGGYGETYLVKSILTDKEYVCKIQEDGKEARREVTTLLALRDLSCVVSIENAWVKDGYCYIILEKLGPCRESVDTIRSSVKKCLGKIHERGLVHGDLNHQNVLCDGKNPVLIDFGEAKDKRAVSSQEFDDLMQEDLDRLTGKYFTFTGQELDENFQTYWPDFKADLDKPNGRDSLMPVK
jgi:serine/threonine protein kinase